MSYTIEIVVAELPNGRYSVHLDGQVLVASAREPFLSAARRLLANGVPPDVLLTMRRDGRTQIDMSGTLADAARLTVIENERMGPRFAKYRPFDAARSLFGRSE